MNLKVLAHFLFALSISLAGCESTRTSNGTNPDTNLDMGPGSRDTGTIDAGRTSMDARGSRDAGEARDGATERRLDQFALDSGAVLVDSGRGTTMDMLAESDLGTVSSRERIRSNCDGEVPIETGLDVPPDSCMDLFRAQPERETGCYRLSNGTGGTSDAYCWRHRALVVLVNNKIDVPFHSGDLDEDGVIDEGPLAGTNHPADPFELTHAEFSDRLRGYVSDWYDEVSYGAIYLDIDSIHKAPTTDGQPERWFRLLRERPGFAHTDIFRQVCEMRGGMTPAQWRAYHLIITVITDGTQVSGSQWRTESLPIGDDCAESVPILGNYVVMKQFRSWGRRGTLFHEIGHGMNRAPNPAGLGHSEAIHVVTGESAEYGDRSDVMGASSNRGHFSLAQKLFLKVLPESLIARVSLDTESLRTQIYPLERPYVETKGIQIQVQEGRSYYVEARRHLGSDEAIPAILKQGVLIKRADPILTARKSWIVDPTPETPSSNSGDSVLLPGRTFSDEANQLHISLLTSDDDVSQIMVRRGASSATPPVIHRVDTQVQGEGYRLEASASAGIVDIPDEDLLFFWGLLTPNSLYTPGSFKNGSAVEFQRLPPGSQLWLYVSDQRGGETIQLIEL